MQLDGKNYFGKQCRHSDSTDPLHRLLLIDKFAIRFGRICGQQRKINRRFGALIDGESALMTAHIRRDVSRAARIDDDIVVRSLRRHLPLLHHGERIFGRLRHGIARVWISARLVFIRFCKSDKLVDKPINIING